MHDRQILLFVRMHEIASFKLGKRNNDSESIAAVVGSFCHCYIGVSMMDQTSVAKNFLEIFFINSFISNQNYLDSVS
jgi:hypothetical protein